MCSSPLCLRRKSKEYGAIGEGCGPRSVGTWPLCGSWLHGKLLGSKRRAGSPCRSPGLGSGETMGGW